MTSKAEGGVSERPAAASGMTLDAAPAAAPYDPETLAALACQIGARPQGAPHFGEVAGALRAVRREAGALVVDYAPQAEDALAAIVAAERVCCAELGWHLERVQSGPTGPVVRLRVEAAPAQLDALAPAFAVSEGA
jgi:hypothetical protein